MPFRHAAGIDDEFIGPLEFSKEFNTHYVTALSIFRRPEFPSVKVNNRWRVRRRDAYRYFKERTDGKSSAR
jgi:hypothetical protein